MLSYAYWTSRFGNDPGVLNRSILVNNFLLTIAGVAQRTREIGIRMALGAQARQVRAMIAREIALMLTIGTIAGTAAALASGRLIQSILYGLNWWDSWICVSAALVVWFVALLAAWIPARRASRGSDGRPAV